MPHTGVAVTWDEGSGRFDFADTVPSSRAGVTERERAAALRAAVADGYASRVEASDRVRASRQAALVEPVPVEWADRAEPDEAAPAPRRRFAPSEPTEGRRARFDGDDPFDAAEDELWGGAAALRASEVPRGPTSAPEPPLVSGGVAGRRTVTIRGQAAERHPAAASSRRSPERVHERIGFNPDRVAMWAVLLGMLLILVAVTSAHAATL
jgi:hypothetical protein